VILKILQKTIKGTKKKLEAEWKLKFVRNFEDKKIRIRAKLICKV